MIVLFLVLGNFLEKYLGLSLCTLAVVVGNPVLRVVGQVFPDQQWEWQWSAYPGEANLLKALISWSVLPVSPRSVVAGVPDLSKNLNFFFSASIPQHLWIESAADATFTWTTAIFGPLGGACIPLSLQLGGSKYVFPKPYFSQKYLKYHIFLQILR